MYIKFISQCFGTAPSGEACRAFISRRERERDRERESARNTAWLGIKSGRDCELLKSVVMVDHSDPVTHSESIQQFALVASLDYY